MTRYLAIALALALLALGGAGLLLKRSYTANGAMKAQNTELAQRVKTAQEAAKRSDKASARLAADRLALARSEALLRQRLDAALALPKNREWADSTVPQEVRDALE